VWGAWIETIRCTENHTEDKSRPVWGAWIETSPMTITITNNVVAPRVGRVD